MIKSYKEMKEYYCADLMMSGLSEKPYWYRFLDRRYKFYYELRKSEYFVNCFKSRVGRIAVKLQLFRYRKMCDIYQWTIPVNVFGKGLSIIHVGTIVVSDKAQIGENCRLHVCVNIGHAISHGVSGAPIIGDNVYIGPGAKIFGAIKIGDNSVIGANAVVNKSFEEGNYTIAGVPAKVITHNDSSAYIETAK